MVKTRETAVEPKPSGASGDEITSEEESRLCQVPELEVATPGAPPLVATHATTDPFGKDIDNAALFRHGQMDALCLILRTCIAKQAMAAITGPPGSGKTTAVRCVTDELPSNKYSVVYLGQDQDGTNVLTRLASALGIQPKRYRPHLAMQISQWLIDNLDAGGKALVLVVDEAHLLDDAMLEEFRLMTNANYDRLSPLTLILLGQPLLRLRLKASHFEALRQRLTYRYSLEGLDQDETIKYIQHRLSLAGMPPDAFSQAAMESIFQISEGLPRRINNACSLALLRAAAAKRSTIDVGFLKELVDLD